MITKNLVQNVLKDTTEILKPYINRASREAQLLLMAHLKKDELWLITNQNTHVENIEKLNEWIQRRIKNEPFEYITNSVSFYSEEFYIKEGALIPRPETELLIDEIMTNISDINSTITIAEVGIGSGIISIILAKKLPNAKIIAVDISQDALDIAKINIKRFNLQDRIELRLGSLLEPISEDINYLVSNPPYIENNLKLESNLDYEPQNALFGGEVGDEIIKQLLDEVLKRKIDLFSCEMGYDQLDKITTHLRNSNFKRLKFYKDYSDFDRGFTLES